MEKSTIIEALKEMKNSCTNNSNCENCRFYSGDDDCMCILVTDEVPSTWEIKEK